MPLLKDTLRTGLISELSGSTSAATAASGLARAYERYALTGTAGGFPPQLLVPVPRAVSLAAVLQPALEDKTADNPAAFAAAWASGLLTFWAGVVFGPGAATSLPGAVALPPVLTGLLAQTGLTLEGGCDLMAGALDVATRTLVVIISGVPVPFV